MLLILGGGVLANKDHSLDDKIIRAAYSEFLAYGFCKASLHKISEKAGAIRLIMGAQFWHFRQLLDKRPDEDRMFACLRSILDFTNAGWRQLCLTLK